MSRWNREAALLGVPDLPEDAFKHVGDGKIKLYGGGGGGSQQSTNTSYTTNVPEYASGAFMDMIGKGQALAETPYQAYGGERISQFTPLQQQAFQQAGNQQVAGQVGLGSGLAAMSGLSSFTNPGTSQQFMSPFIMGALAPQLQELSRQSAIQGTQQQADAVGRGAFGGSRDAIMRAERERNLMQQQSDVLGRGLQAAFESGQGQFNQEQANRLQAANALGQLGQTQFGQQMDITGLQSQMGATQQNQIQRILDQQYADFQQQRDYPYQQIGFMSDLLRGTGSSTRNIYTTPQASPLQTLAGLGTLGVGLTKADGGEVKGYAGGGLTGLLSDEQLQQRTQEAPTPMGQLAAQNESVERAMLRGAAPQGLPMEEPDLTEEQVVEILKEALRAGDAETAAVAQEVLQNLRAQNEQGVAGIAPGSVGEMPEGGIAGMAAGGPVSFSTGNEVRNPYKSSLDRQREEDRRRASALATGVGGQLEKSGAAIADIGLLPLRAATGVYDTAVVRPFRALGVNAAYLSPLLVPEGVDPSSMTPFYDRIRARNKRTPTKQVDTAKVAEGSGRGIAAGPTAAQMAQAYQENPRVMQGLPALQAEEGKAPPGDTAPPKAPAAPGLSGIAQFANLYRQAGYDPAAQSAAELQSIQELARARESSAEKNMADLLAEQAERGVFDEAGEKRAKSEIEALEGSKKDAKKMAIIQAGLAILAGDPRRGALAAIGEGAMQGVSQYKGDVAELEARREKINARLDRIAEIRRQESIADGKERSMLRRQRNELEVEAKKDVAAFTKDQGVRTGQFAGELVKMEVDRREKEMDRATQASRASQASTPEGIQLIERIAADLKIPFSQAYEYIQGTKRDPATRERLQLEWSKAQADPLRMAMLRRQGITTFDQYEAAAGRAGARAGAVDSTNPLLN